MKKTILVTSLALLVGACAEPPPPAAVPKLVRVMKLGAGEAAPATSARTYSGEVRARSETTLAFRIAGKLIERRVDAGAAVKPGQVLARLDATDVALQAAQTQAQRELAAAELKRFRDLQAKNFVSASALDAKETAFKAADAQASLAKNQTAYAVLSADRAGLIGQVLAEPGQVVSAGQPVFRLAPDGEREIAIAVPESELAHFAVGQSAEVRLWADGVEAAPLAGRLREIAPVADPVTRTYALRVSLKNADPRLPLGMTATVRFAPAAERAANGTGQSGTLVPLSAIFQQGDKPAVWKVGADDTVSLHPVQIAAYTDAGARVVAGLAAGDRLVAAGVNLLAAGEKVRVSNYAAAR